MVNMDNVVVQIFWHGTPAVSYGFTYIICITKDFKKLAKTLEKKIPQKIPLMLTKIPLDTNTTKMLHIFLDQ